MVDAADITNLTPHNSSQSFEQDNLPIDGSCKSIPKVYATASDSPTSEFSAGCNLQNKLDPLHNITGGQCKMILLILVLRHAHIICYSGWHVKSRKDLHM